MEAVINKTRNAREHLEQGGANRVGSLLRLKFVRWRSSIQPRLDRTRIAPKSAPLLSSLRLRLPVSRLDIRGGLRQITSVTPGESLPEHLQAGVRSFDVHESNQSSVAVNRVRPDCNVLTN